MKSDSIVIIPTYNEKENIEKIIRAVFGLEKDFDILVIDDGSPDGTAAIVKSLIANEFADRLHILERSGSWAWVRLISLDSSGPWSKVMTLSSRWMPTLVMILMTCHVSMLLRMMKDMMWL